MDGAWRYDGRRVVVTGAASGIGAATVATLTALGASVVGIDVRPHSATAVHLTADLGAEHDVDRVAREVAEAHAGRVDGLFHCAGITGNNPLDRVMRVNFLGLRRLTDHLVPLVPEGGAVVSVASVAGARWRDHAADLAEFLALDTWEAALDWCAAHPEHFPRGGYSFSKQCVIAWTLASCVHLGRHGVRINCISPGNVDTPMLQDAAAIGGQAAVDAVPRPLGRNSRPDEQANVLAFLNSQAASYVTGHDLWTDGGLLGGIAFGTHEYPLVASPLSR